MLSDGDLARRPYHAWNEDGLPEIWGACYCAIVAAVYAAPLHPHLRMFRGLLPVPLVLLGFWILRRVKARTTAPRVGYVEPAAFTRASVIWGSVAGIAISAFVLVALFRFPRAIQTMHAFAMPAVSIMAGIMGIVGALATSTPRFFAVAAVPIAFGAWALQSGADLRAAPWLLLSMGAAMALTGSWTFVRFRRTHPIHTDSPS